MSPQVSRIIRSLGLVIALVVFAAGPALAACPIPFELEVALLVNQERAGEGLAPLQIDDRLQTAAQRHADDMASHNFMSHTGSDDSTFDQRIHREGYAGGSLGENVAAGYGSPASVVEGWMNSAGHRANILRASFTHIGVGYAYGANTNYGSYWAQSFGGGTTLVSECAEGTGEGVAEADCQDQQLAALGRLCRRQLSCHARHAKRPDHPKAAERLAKCLAKGDGKFSRAWDAALADAAASLSMCTVSDPAGPARADLAGSTTQLTASIVAGQDVANARDGKLRAKLLQETGRLCAGAFDGAAPSARLRFDDRTANAAAKAERKGVVYDGAARATVGDAAEAIAGGWVAATTPSAAP